MPIRYQHSPLLQAVMDSAEMDADKSAVIMNGVKVSYLELATNIRKSASVLRALGIQYGDCIMLSAHKDIEYIYLYLGAHILGITNVIVDAESNEDRLHFIEDKVQPKYCFGSKSERYPSSLFPELDITGADEYTTNEGQVNDTDIAEILFTTGTTGNPKGVCLSYANIYASASNINSYIGNKSDDIELLALPICHSFGMGRIRCTLLKGATIIILGSFANVRAMFKAIEDFHVTGFGVVPAAWAYIRKMSGRRIGKYASQIRYIEIGSASMPSETKKEMLELFPDTRICMHYGLTEASRNCFQEFHDLDHLDTIGKPVCDKVDVQIYDEEGTQLKPGEKGELCVKGNMVLARYLDPKDNENAFWGEYFRTGDCGFIDKEGYIHLLGREKELINVGGKKVSPMEVEDATCALGVGDCVCVPMKDPDGIMGELVVCYILKDSTTLTFGEIAQQLSEKLEFYKRPVAYEWIDKIPQTSSGKKQRLQINKK